MGKRNELYFRNTMSEDEEAYIKKAAQYEVQKRFCIPINTAFCNLERLVVENIKIKSSSDSTKGDLNRVNMEIINLKKNLLGINHMLARSFYRNTSTSLSINSTEGTLVKKLFNRL